MDGILSLFENITLPNNHAFILEDYLKICAEHQVFINKTANDVKPVISYMNDRLNSTSNRLEGLRILQTFLPQCLKEIFRENALGWLHQCLKGTDGKSTQITRLSYKLIKTLLEMTQQLPELRRNVGSIVVVKLVENLQIKCPSQSLLSIFECLETLMCNYGPACGHHKNVLEKILLRHIDGSDGNVVHKLARCMAQVPLLSNAGPSGANHIARWYQEQQRLCATLHGILDELFFYVEENQSMFDVTISSTKLPLPEVSNDNLPLTKIIRLVNRFTNVAEILQALLLLKFSAEKTVNVESVLHLVCRGLNVTGKSFRDSAAAEIQMTRALLPRIQIALLKVLNSLIICARHNLILYGTAICKQVYHVLSWTSTSKWPYSIEKPYGELRATACYTLMLWLQASSTSSCVEKVADKLVNNLIPDINPGRTAVTLIEDATPKKGSSKQQKKSTIAERNNQTTAISPDIEVHLASPNANIEICRAALRVMQWVFVASSSYINPVIHEKLQNITVRLLNDIQKTGKRDMLPVPYGDGQCRCELHRLLLMIVMNPHPMRPVPTSQALSIFSGGSSDTYHQVAVTCQMGSGFLEKLVTGTRPTWHFPITVEEMLDSMNAQREDMEQEIEDEAEQMEDEVLEEEEEDIIEEEEEEDEEDEEEEEEEIDDELELSKIKVGEAVTLLPDKATAEQMEVEEEPAKKIENKKAQRPVEKPEANKKDEEDEVEVLTEDEVEWPSNKDRKEKIAPEADEMIEDEEEFASDEEDEEGIEIRDDEDLEEDYEDEEEDSAEIESEGEEIERGFIMSNNPIKIIPVEVEKKDVAICESKNDIQKSEVTQQLAESVTEVALASTEHIQSQDKVSLPSTDSNQEKAKELDSSTEVQVQNVERSNEILESSVEENAEQNKEVVNTATEETEESSAKEEHISKKIDINSQNEVEKDRVVEEVPEFQDLEDHIAVSVVEKFKNGMEYQVINDRDDVQDGGNDDGMHEECDEQLEEENAFESKNDVPVEHQEENQNEVLDTPDKITEEIDKNVTEEPVHEPEVHENVCEIADNELIQNDVATVESEVVQHEDDTDYKLEVSDEMDKQDVLEEGVGEKKEDTCEKEEFVSQQDSDIPKPEDHALSDEVCIDKDNTVVDSGDGEAKVAAISEIKEVEAEEEEEEEEEEVQMDVNEMPETELSAAAQKIAHSSEDEVEEPSRKKMKMDITATLTDGPKTIDTEISNVSADVKLNSTGEITKSERVMNGTATATDEMTEEELISSFVPEVATDE